MRIDSALRIGALGLFAATWLGTSGCSPETDSGADARATADVAVAAADADGTADAGAALLEEAADEALGHHVAERYPGSLERVLRKRYLRVLTSRNAFDYFLQRGRRGGLQYEMVSAFTKKLNERHPPEGDQPEIQFELIPVHDDQLIPLLRDGAADLIAARLTITPERAELVRFSRPYRTVDERVVRHDRAPPVASKRDLAGRTVAVRETSSYYESLEALSRELVADGLEPVRIELVDEALATERILELVAARRFPYTVADSIVAEAAVRIHPSLRVVPNVALRHDAQLAWATLPAAEDLAREVDRFLAGYREGSLLGNLVVARYFEGERRLAARLAQGEDGKDIAISPYDAIFRREASRFDVDWRLVASMAYQESRFDQTARNRWGAVGLLQIKPETANEPYVDVPRVEGAEHAEDNVEAGLKYLCWIKQRYFDSIEGMRERDRLRMALAAYNAGPRTILRARQLARKRGLDSKRWFRNVELALLEMGRQEPVHYVSEINQRFLAYVLLGIE